MTSTDDLTPKRPAPLSADDVLHDVGNLLTTIAALTVRARASLDGETSASAKAATEMITQLGSAVGNAMTLARTRGVELPGEDGLYLAAYISEHEQALGAIVGGPEHLRVHVAECLGDTAVRMHETDFLRVLVNVLRNAEEASTDDKTIDLELDLVVFEEPIDARPRRLPPERYAVVRISDRGEGVDEELLDVLIEPGVSSKAPGRGRGLSVVAQLLDEVSGGLRIGRREGGGSTVEIFVPA